MKEAVTKVIDTLTQQEFHRALQKLLEQYKYIAAGGDYFEGDKSFICVLSIKVPYEKRLYPWSVLLHSNIVVIQKQKLHHFCNRSSPGDGPKSGRKYLGYIQLWKIHQSIPAEYDKSNTAI